MWPVGCREQEALSKNEIAGVSSFFTYVPKKISKANAYRTVSRSEGGQEGNTLGRRARKGARRRERG